MSNPNDAVRRSVRAEMARRGLLQAELAKAIGMTQQALSRRLVGATPFSIGEVVDIATAMRVPTATLLPDSQVESVAS